MRRFRITLLLGLIHALVLGPSSISFAASPASPEDPPVDPAKLAAIEKQVATQIKKLGEKAGTPEEPDRYLPIPADSHWLSIAEAKGGFTKFNQRLEQMRWWKVGLDPASLDHALREPASIISGCVAASRAGLDDSARSLAIAKDAAAFLLWAQQQADTGGFPFPSARNVRDKRAFIASEKFLSRAEHAGHLDQVLHNGWIVDDATDGGLQFDNAEASLAMLDLYELTHERQYLDSARKAADWAITRPIVKNWNYNSFSVRLLARAFAVTHDPKYLHAAIEKALLGVIPGQLPDGPHSGRWLDPHNAKPAYHYIMMCALAELAAVLPEDHSARVKVLHSLQLGLLARNRDFLGPGAPNKDKAMDALLFVNRLFASQPELLHRTRSAEALHALGLLVSQQYQQGQAPLGPREWGMFLESIVLAKTPAP